MYDACAKALPLDDAPIRDTHLPASSLVPFPIPIPFRSRLYNDFGGGADILRVVVSSVWQLPRAHPSFWSAARARPPLSVRPSVAFVQDTLSPLSLRASVPPPLPLWLSPFYLSYTHQLTARDRSEILANTNRGRDGGTKEREGEEEREGGGRAISPMAHVAGRDTEFTVAVALAPLSL